MRYQKLLFITGILGLVSTSGIVPTKPPVCFLIGDSISVHYGPFLEQYLDDLVIIQRKDGDEEALKDLDIPAGASGGDSRMVLDFLRVKLQDPNFRPDYFIFNYGLHDIKHNGPDWRIQINLEEYKSNLRSTLALLTEKNIHPIWIRTTPVVDSIHNARQPAFKRYSKDLDRYNNAADKICREEKVPVIDLYSFTLKFIPEHYIDHVHYDEETRALQAAFLAGAIRECLANK